MPHNVLHMNTTAHRVTLAQHRTGTESTAALTAVEKVEIPAPGPGEVVVRTTWLQLPAVTADLMRADPGLPMPGMQVGAPVTGPGIGTVIASNADGLPVGTAVVHMQGWQEVFVASATEVFPVHPGLPEPQYALNQGVTAYHGIVDVAEVGPGDVVFVSGAAGGVGSLAGQIAKALGARVIGSAGGPAKVAYLVDELGFDAAVDYRAGDLAEQLREVAPEGITVFFDTVGGDAFEAAVKVAAYGARFALCGALAGQLDDSDGAHPRLDIMTAIVKELVIKPFCTFHTPEQIVAWNTHYGQWLVEGRIVYPATVVDGRIEDAPAVLDAMLSGAYRGNVLVRVTEE